jgi:hypothetical protein
VLVKVSGGLYYSPAKSRFGQLPSEESKVLKAYLKDPNFLTVSPSSYNALGLGTTQLYNSVYVYNRKRQGVKVFNGVSYHFKKRFAFPAKADEYFLLVDLVNNLRELSEEAELVKSKLATKVTQLDETQLKRAVVDYGSARTQKYFAALLKDEALKYGELHAAA